MIGSIQLLRGLAALSVVIYHTSYLEPADFMGVAVFFVISGFIVTYVTRDDASGFFTKRLIRIVPLYWAATLFTVIWFRFGFANPPRTWPLFYEWAAHNPRALVEWFVSNYAAAATPELWGRIATSLLFIPTAEQPALGVGWTLNLEMMFYAVFGLCLLVSRKWAPALAAVAIVGIQIASREIECGPVCSAYSSDYLRFFALGIGVFYAWRCAEGIVARHQTAAAALSILVIAAWPLFALWPRSTEIHYSAPTVIVFAALCLHSAGFTMRGTLIMAFGAISYALYLLHPLVVETMRATAPLYPWMAPNTLTGALACVVGSLMLAVAAYYGFEKPTLQRLNSATRRRTNEATGLAAPRLI